MSSVESFSLTEAIRGESGFHTARRWHDEGIFDEPEVVALRRRMISAAADLVRRMHFAGLAHQDLFWQHLFFETRPDGRMTARVIDLQRMIRPASAAAWGYFWIKDMEQVRFSMQRMGFRDEDVAHWYQCYFATARTVAVAAAVDGRDSAARDSTGDSDGVEAGSGFDRGREAQTTAARRAPE